MDPRGWQDLFARIRREKTEAKRKQEVNWLGMRLFRRGLCDGCSENESDLRGTVYEMRLDDGDKKMNLALCVFCLALIQDLIARGRLAIPVGEGAYDA